MAKLITSAKLNKKKIKNRTISKKINQSKTITAMFFVLLLCAISVLYVIQTNNIATKGYDIEKYERKLEALQRENNKKTVELARLKSMQNLYKEKEKLTSVDNKNIKYIMRSSSIVVIDKK